MTCHSDLTIRPYRNSDHSRVRVLFIAVNRQLAPPDLREAFEEYITLSLREEIDRIAEYFSPERWAGFWVACEGERIVGFFGLEPAGASALELRRMYVDPRRRRMGIGSAMLKEAERQSRERRACKVVLSTSELQTAALSLYQGAGYTLVCVEDAPTTTNKSVGHQIRRAYFEKLIDPAACNGTPWQKSPPPNV
jgi:putative acetyltransferase